MEILSLVPRYPNITMEEVEDHLKDPELGGTTYPFGRPEGADKTRTGAAHDEGGQRKGIVPVHKSRALKYSIGRVPSGLKKIMKKNLPLSGNFTRRKWRKWFFKVSSMALAAST